MSFDDDISQEQIDKRLSLFGGNWIEFNEKGEQVEKENR